MCDENSCNNLDLLSKMAHKIGELDDKVTLLSSAVIGLLKPKKEATSLPSEKEIVSLMEEEGCSWEDATNRLMKERR